MQFSTIKDIALAIGMDAKELLADIKAIFGDEFPLVRDWKQNTKLPDDTITYRIMEYYGIKQEIQKNNLPNLIPTTLPALITEATPAQRSALQQIMVGLENGFAEFFNIQVTKSVIGAYFDACDTAYDFISRVVDEDLTSLQNSSSQAYSELEEMLKQHYTSASQRLGKWAVAKTTAADRAQKCKDLIQSMKESLTS